MNVSLCSVYLPAMSRDLWACIAVM